MQIIDVTLRDGGHVREFNWPMKLAQDHYKALCKIQKLNLQNQDTGNSLQKVKILFII